MRNVQCYKCQGDGFLPSKSCKYLCGRSRPNYKLPKCDNCKHRVHLDSMLCNVCNGLGFISWIDELFRKE